ncbi:Major capsid protein [Bienertia sinuspersici]
MDKEKGREWMQCNDRLSKAYIDGVSSFLEYAFSKVEESHLIACPCNKCQNASHYERNTVKNHLIVYGIDKGYTTSYFHGESLIDVDHDEDEKSNELDVGEDDDEIGEMLHDMFPNIDQMEEEEPNDYAKNFYDLLQDNEQPLYEGSRCSKLSALVNLLHFKSEGGCSNDSFSKLLDYMVKELLLLGSCFPNSYYEAKKVIRGLGLSYKKIDACRNHCMLYWKECENAESFIVCKLSRWKEDKISGEHKVGKSGKKTPAKTLRYLSLKPRLQKLFMSSKTASLMGLHHDREFDANIARHPADSKACKDFDELHLTFSMEPRNTRLGLASDGF